MGWPGAGPGSRVAAGTGRNRTLATFLPALGALATASLLLGGVAGAVSVSGARAPIFILPTTGEFLSPSGNISCEIDWHRSQIPNEVSCQSLQPPRSVQLTPTGSVKVCSGVQCLGNPAEGTPTLPYGASVARGPFRCSSSSAGVTCTVAGQGFRIASSGVVRIGAAASAAVGSFVMPSRYPVLLRAQGFAKLLALDSTGRYAQLVLTCGRTASGTALDAGSRWTVDLAGVVEFEVETNTANPAAGHVETFTRSAWATLVRRVGWSGAIVLDQKVTSVDDGPNLNLCSRT